MFERELSVAAELAKHAGRILMDVYARDFAVAFKAKNDPVTEADQLANAYLVAALRQHFPDDGIVAEESPEQGDALTKSRCWFVDPLDGTKEFIAKNGEFSVMLGLAIDGQSRVGAVYQPARDKLYLGAVGGEAWLATGGEKRRLRVSDKLAGSTLKLVVSRSHRPDSIAQIMQKLGASEEMPSGSVGVKVGLIAEQLADLYVHVSDKSSLWDACGPEAILHAAGGRFTHVDGTPISYRSAQMQNKKGILAVNALAFPEVLAAVSAVAKQEGFLS